MTNQCDTVLETSPDDAPRFFSDGYCWSRNIPLHPYAHKIISDGAILDSYEKQHIYCVPPFISKKNIVSPNQLLFFVLFERPILHVTRRLSGDGLKLKDGPSRIFQGLRAVSYGLLSSLSTCGRQASACHELCRKDLLSYTFLCPATRQHVSFFFNQTARLVVLW